MKFTTTNHLHHHRQTPTQQTLITIINHQACLYHKKRYIRTNVSFATLELQKDVARRKEQKAKDHLCLWPYQKIILLIFHKMTNAKEMWDAPNLDLGGNDGNPRRCKSLSLSIQLRKGFSVSNNRKAYTKVMTRFQSLLKSAREFMEQVYSTEDANQKFLRSPTSILEDSKLVNIERRRLGYGQLNSEDEDYALMACNMLRDFRHKRIGWQEADLYNGWNQNIVPDTEDLLVLIAKATTDNITNGIGGLGLVISKTLTNSTVKGTLSEFYLQRKIYKMSHDTRALCCLDQKVKARQQWAVQ
ncbi:hypothetical protein Tco_0778248 [Tanacetum coccineum]